MLALACVSLPAGRVAAQGTAFNYQGFLNTAGTPANGSFGVSFTLYPTATNGTRILGTTNAAVLFTNGLFATTVDFGPGIFTGASYWLEVAVQTNAGGAYYLLPPRQLITPTPYALYATTAASATVAGLASNVVPGLNIANAVITSSSFAGNGAGLTNLVYANLTGAPLIPGTNGFVTSAVTNGLATTNFVLGFFGNSLTWAIIPPYTNSSLSFAPAATLPAGHYPEAVVAADVNLDGSLDLVAANSGSGSLTVFTNNTHGSFGSNATIPMGSQPMALATADINGDGAPDLACVNWGDNTLQVLTNNGTGHLGSQLPLPTGNQPIALITADVNRDGKPDFITVNYGDNTLNIFTNNGSGILGGDATCAVGNSPLAIAAGDLNGDGWVDLVVANSGDGTVTVLTNNRAGGFLLAATLTAGGAPSALALVNVYGNGQPALVAANYNDNTLTVFTNNGAGGFGRETTLAVGYGPAALATADVNLDGYADLIVADKAANTLNVLLNNYSGSFVWVTNLTVGSYPSALVAADLNGDGQPDLASANQNSFSLTVLTNASTVAISAQASGPVANFNGNFNGSGTGLTNVPASAITGGLTTNLPVTVPGGRTNTLVFQNGILVQIK